GLPHLRASDSTPMKTHAAGVFQAAVVRALLCIAVLPLCAQMSAPLLLQAPDALTWQITQRDFHSQTWEASAVVVDPISGKTRVQQHKFIELCSGKNFWDEETKSFQPTREQFEITPDGNYAVARLGPAQLIVENNINSA